MTPEESRPRPGLASVRDTLRFLRMVVRFRRYVRPQLPRLGLALLGALGFAAMTLLEPWPLQILFDAVLLHRKIRVHVPGLHLQFLAHLPPQELLTGAVVAMLVIAVLRGQFYYLENVLAAVSGQAVVMSIRHELFE